MVATTQRPFRTATHQFGLGRDPATGGLACTSGGVFLAGIPLLKKTPVGLAPRTTLDVAILLRSGYGQLLDIDPVTSGLAVAAAALNAGDLSRATIAALHLCLPELNEEEQLRISKADELWQSTVLTSREIGTEGGRQKTRVSRRQASRTPPTMNAIYRRQRRDQVPIGLTPAMIRLGKIVWKRPMIAVSRIATFQFNPPPFFLRRLTLTTYSPTYNTAACFTTSWLDSTPRISDRRVRSLKPK